MNDILKQNFPEISQLFPYQEELLSWLQAGKNSLGIIATGGGKSLIFQLQALMEPGLTIVISPLLALMAEQVNDLQEKGILAATLNGQMSFLEQREFLRKLPQQNLKLLYVSPERLQNTLFLKAVEAYKDHISLIVIDEAHCISQWGSSFRPDYSRIPSFIASLQQNNVGPKVLALTATLAQAPREDIQRHFFIEKTFIPNSIIRDNLKLEFKQVEEESEKAENLKKWLDGIAWNKGLVYLYSRKKCEELADEFRGYGIRAGYFHAGCDESHKRETYQGYKNGDIQLLFATSAFGMGINIPDIDAVAHFQIPHSVEEYYQMVGRGWRKRPVRECKCLMLWSEINFEIRERDLKKEIDNVQDVLPHINKLFGKGRRSVSKNSLRSISRDDFNVKENHILKQLYPILIEEGVLEHLGSLPKQPTSIEMKHNTQLWKEVLTKFKQRRVKNSFKTIETKFDIPFEEVLQHIYDEELAGNVQKFPAMDHQLFFRAISPDLTEGQLQAISGRLTKYLNRQIEEHHELKTLFTSKPPEAYLQSVLG